MALSFFDKEVGGVNKLWVNNGTVAGTHVVGSLGSGAIASDLTIGSQVFCKRDLTAACRATSGLD
jgi:hypothetical protein